jgi:hypothetical protein
MMKKFLTLMALSPFITNLVSAVVTEISMEERTQKTLQLSEDQINRIAVSEGIVSTIITNPSKFNIRIDESLGQAFVTLKAPIQEPEGFTVITDSGAAQDFLVTSYSGEPAIVYLNEPYLEETSNYILPMFHFKDFNGVYHGLEVEGFERRLLRQNETVEVGDLLPYVQEVNVYESPFEKLYVFTVKNYSRKDLKIHPECFSNGETMNWFFCPVIDLKKNSETKIVISKRRV